MATDQILSDRYKDQQDWCWQQQQQPKQQLKNTAPNQEQDDDQDHTSMETTWGKVSHMEGVQMQLFRSGARSTYIAGTIPKRPCKV